jgi:anti-sigma regulatory factor (Ser/Thr protein kinase)
MNTSYKGFAFLMLLLLQKLELFAEVADENGVESDSQAMGTKLAVFTLLPFLIAFIFVFFIFYRRQRENSWRRNQLDLELRALRAQTSPHFIFNCLNSIHSCIIKQESEKAGQYLLKFSFLLRRVLENSYERWISVEEDVKMLRAYMDLERLRTGNLFSYHIEVEEKIDAENLSLPMLLAQPLIENSIWHGFSGNERSWMLLVRYFVDEDYLYVCVTDNGLPSSGSKAEKPLGKRLSLGTTLIKDQLRAISELDGKEAKVYFEEIKSSNGTAEGHKATITLPKRAVY